MTHASLEKDISLRAVDIEESPSVSGNVELRPLTETAAAARGPTPEELAAAIVHEVTQPLTALLTNAEAGLRWIQRPSPDLDEVRRSVEAIIAEGRRACDIIRGVRDFIGKEPLVRQELTISDLVEDAIGVVQHDIFRAKVELRLQIGSKLPAVAGNRVQLQQVLVNLILNATQAMAGQKSRRRLLVNAYPTDAEFVAISIRDTGPGIDKQSVHRLFEPFFTTKQGGMGMGLAICRMTVAAHGGLIDVDSALGAGATFRVLIPVCKPSERR